MQYHNPLKMNHLGKQYPTLETDPGCVNIIEGYKYRTKQLSKS
jgi:hypothetical protein